MSILDKFKISEPEGRQAELLKTFKGHEGVIQLQPGGWTYQHAYTKFADQYATFKHEKDDVIVSTFPKSGTTWTQEIVWTMRNNPELDPEKSKQPLHMRVPNLEADCQIDHIEKPESFKEMCQIQFPGYDPDKGLCLQAVYTSPRPRTIKCHLPFELTTPTLLDNAKIVYVIRDPRDVCLSYLHHSRLFLYENFDGTQDDYITAFLEGLVIFGPYWSHVKQAWEKRKHPNMHIMFYEKIIKDPNEEYAKLDKFIGTKLTSEQIAKIVEYTSFSEMKNRKQHAIIAEDEPLYFDMEFRNKAGGFFRQGIAGGWRKFLTQEQKNKFDVWIKKNCPDQEIMENILNP